MQVVNKTKHASPRGPLLLTGQSTRVLTWLPSGQAKTLPGFHPGKARPMEAQAGRVPDFLLQHSVKCPDVFMHKFHFRVSEEHLSHSSKLGSWKELGLGCQGPGFSSIVPVIFTSCNAAATAQAPTTNSSSGGWDRARGKVSSIPTLLAHPQRSPKSRALSQGVGW